MTESNATIQIPAPVQFQYNADYPDLPPADPAHFPPADLKPCARITTRVYSPDKNQVATVQNVLVRTLMPPRADMDDSSSTDSDDSSHEDDIMEDVDAPAMPTPVVEERAYWMQRTVREAIYGRVLYAIVLRRRQRDPLVDPSLQADWEVTKEQCAIKEMSWEHIRKEKDKLAEDPIKEVSAMQYFKTWHARTNGTSSEREAMLATNIIMPLDFLSDDRHLFSVMPFCSGGELFERLDLNERFTEEEARHWMYNVLNALENLQSSGICHRDMSLENLLVHENGCLVIDMGMCLRIPYASQAPQGSTTLSDSFGSMSLARINGGTQTTNGDPYECSGKNAPRHLITPQGTCGKWIYMSPEVYTNTVPFDGFAVDMWAAGVILFLMLTGFPPWERPCSTDDRFKYMTAGYLVQMLTEWEIGLTSDAMDLLQRMLFIDPKDRLSLEQVRAHPWMVNGRRVAPGL